MHFTEKAFGPDIYLGIYLPRSTDQYLTYGSVCKDERLKSDYLKHQVITVKNTQASFGENYLWA